VRDLLGHASIITTERYDNQKLENLQAAAARLERGETFDPGARDSTSPSICQVSVKSSADAEPGEQIDRARETAPNYGDDPDLGNWPGGRDSCPFATSRRRVAMCLKTRRAANERATKGRSEGCWLAVRDDFRNWFIVMLAR
jgi:hypothetical protein